MAMLPRVLIGIPGAGCDTSVTAPVYAIDVTHLETRIITPTELRSLRGATEGVRIVLPGRDEVDVTVDDESFRLTAGIVLVVDGKAQLATSQPAPGESAADSPPPLHVIECNALVGGAFPIGELLDLPLLLTEAEHAATLQRLFEQITFGDTPIPRLPGGVDISRHLTAMLLVTTLLKAAGAETVVQRKRSRDERVPQLRQFLLANMGRNVEVPEMARHLGMSRTAFFRWANQRLGCPPLKYLRTMRLERSEEWIVQNAGSLEQIANQTGFADCSHLRREFKKHFGMTPVAYRKWSLSSHQADFLARAAERLFNQDRFEEALATFEQALQGKAPAPVRDRIHYQKGLCLRALGRGDEAIHEWQGLRASGLSQRAGILESRQLFQMGSHDRSLALIRLLHANASDLQKQDLIYLWMDQARALMELKRPKPLRQYLALRGDLFAHDSHSMGLAVNALRMLGDELEVLEQCKELPIACFHAMRRAGRYDETIERYGDFVSPMTIIDGAFLQGRYDDVLRRKPEIPLRRAEALVALGRAGEAIERYPGHSACAYLALGRYEELLERFSPSDVSDESYAAALLALGRTQELDALMSNSRGGWKWSMALLCLRPDAALISSHPDASRHANDAHALIALDALLADDTFHAEAALEQIQGIRSEDFWWYDHHGTELFIVALLRGMLGQPDQMHGDLEEIVANHKYKDKQALWHDAAYLSGKINAAEYRTQPQQSRIEERLTFVRAVANDLKGRRAPARKGYEATLHPRVALQPSDLLPRRFAEWRLQQL